MAVHSRRTGNGSRGPGGTGWQADVAVPPSECSPRTSSLAVISGVQSAHIVGGTFTVAGSGSTQTIVNNYTYGPSEVPLDVLEILNSLSLPNFRNVQLDTLSKATEGTCIWLTTDTMFLCWIKKGKILWGVGIPGAGKTVLSSIIIRYLERLEEVSGSHTCVAFIYLRYSEPLSIRDILESLVKQFVERHTDLAPIVRGLYAKHKHERTRPSQHDLMDVLRAFIKCGKTPFFVIDALDEMGGEDRPILLSLLASLDANLFITSRPLETLQRQFPEARIFNIAARPSDLDLHIREFLRHSPDVLALLKGTNFKERIVEAVHRKSGGMFLHAKLQLEALRNCVSSLDLEETLDGFPTDIEAIYMKTWERILAQRPKHSNLAKLVLLWITHAHGEMTIDALRRAVATSPDTYDFEPKRMVPEALLLSVCCGLVSVDEKTKLVRLIHYTTRDAILPRLLELYPTPHTTLAHICIAYLTKCGFQNYTQEAAAGNRYRDSTTLLGSDALLAYAYHSWAHHLSPWHQSPPSVIAAVTEFVLKTTEYPFPILSNTMDDFGGPLHLAAFYGLEGLISLVAQSQSPNVHTEICRRSPLMLAVRVGNLACAKALLSLPGIDVNVCDRFGWNALKHAAFHGHIECSQLLVDAPGIKSSALSTVVISAARWSRTDAAKLLLGLRGINVNAADEKGWTALMHAARHGDEEIVKLLVEAGADPNVVSIPAGVNGPDGDYKNGWTSLIVAARKGRTRIVKQLLEAPGIDVNVVSIPDRQTALSHASIQGHGEIVALLLAFPGTFAPVSLYLA
ncbi:hypothetical protein BKA70DRAFT_1557799 [Coprinopsis sp. MPI-PUGE-AT-0042]|nr:hypothetical protein BKA70DRAFT_1557799 [Coprinopsis sp. MPI-PUGE-AT-0042]